MLAVVSSSLGALGAVPSTASACSCAPRTTRQFHDSAVAVLEGRVTAVLPNDQGGSVGTLSVLRTWKGTLSTSIQVATAPHSGLCGVDFRVGSSYILFLDSSSGQYTSSSCNGSRESDPAVARVLDLVKSAPAAGAEPSVEPALVPAANVQRVMQARRASIRSCFVHMRPWTSPELVSISWSVDPSNRVSDVLVDDEYTNTEPRRLQCIQRALAGARLPRRAQTVRITHTLQLAVSRRATR